MSLRQQPQWHLHPCQQTEGIENVFEYYVEAENEEGKILLFPVTAPKINNTVVIID